ncbi:hypothetical protein QTP88_001206 [Uroleucon formosanum]
MSPAAAGLAIPGLNLSRGVGGGKHRGGPAGQHANTIRGALIRTKVSTLIMSDGRLEAYHGANVVLPSRDRTPPPSRDRGSLTWSGLDAAPANSVRGTRIMPRTRGNSRNSRIPARPVLGRLKVARPTIWRYRPR